MNRAARLIPGALSLLCLLAGPARADEAADLRALLEARAPAIVTVKAVVKAEIRMMGQAQDEEQRLELQGAVIDPSGLVVLSSSAFSAARMQEMLENMGAPEGIEIDLTPVSLEVVTADGTQLKAFLAATDARLDLSFLQVEGLGERQLAAIDLAGEAPEVEVGQQVAQVTRLGEGYDFAPVFEVGRVSGQIKKPRRAWSADGLSGLGLPVFTTGGQVVGVLGTVSAPSSGEGGELGGLMRMMSGGGAGGGMRPFIYPARVVKAIVEQARTRAAELLEERAKNPPAEAPAPEGSQQQGEGQQQGGEGQQQQGGGQQQQQGGGGR